MQYAHARTSKVARNAAEDGVDRADGFDPELLDHETESALLAILGSSRAWWPRRPSCASRTGSRATSRSSPATYHKLVRQLPGDADTRDEQIGDLHRTRLWLNDATGQVLPNGLACSESRTRADVTPPAPTARQ